MLASTVCEDESKTSADVTSRGDLKPEKVGSDAYQQNHMDLIFRENLSFSGFERNKVFLGKPGGYTDLSRISGADSESDCRAVLVADFDDDGDCDLFTNTIQRETHHLFRNDLPRDAAHQSIKIKLRGTRGHPDAIGATIVMRGPHGAQAQVLACGSGFESQSADEIVFGIGSSESAPVSVLWPGRKRGEEESFGTLQPGRYLLVEGEGTAQIRKALTFAFGDPGPRGIKIGSGATLEHLDLLTLDNEAHQLTTRSDIPVLVNFWSTTCTSCLAEMPELARLHGEKKYRVIAVSLDRKERSPVIEKLRKKLGMNFEVFRIGDAQASELFDLSRLAIPVTFVLRDGKIERILQGRIKKGDL